jgi:hypothetical protein
MQCEYPDCKEKAEYDHDIDATLCPMHAYLAQFIRKIVRSMMRSV